jgi:hypothetical protein
MSPRTDPNRAAYRIPASAATKPGADERRRLDQTDAHAGIARRLDVAADDIDQAAEAERAAQSRKTANSKKKDHDRERERADQRLLARAC